MSRTTPRILGTLWCCSILVLLFALGAGQVSAAPPETSQPAAGSPSTTEQPASPAAGCMDCHKDPALVMDLPSGEKLSLYVDESSMADSVHGDKLICTDCHGRITGYPHRKAQAADRRAYSTAQYEACKRCHFANYTKTLDSIHYETQESGNPRAPLCTDCHGYHRVTRPDQPRSNVSGSCGTCHPQVAQAYRKSVHGAALEGSENPDVPVCTSCHGAHQIRDASAAAFRLNSPEMCAKCHADVALMAKYGLSPNVFKTYVQDFHGTTVALTKQRNQNGWTDKAVCSDCHGVHDIQSVRNGDASELRRNIAATCRKCHSDAGANFPDAWLSHYELSPTKAPLPWLVRTAYALVIPFMVTGLVLHLVVDLWRIARNR